MPLVPISLREGKSEQYRRALSAAFIKLWSNPSMLRPRIDFKS